MKIVLCSVWIVHRTRYPSASLHRHHQLIQQPSESIAILLCCCCVGGGLILSNYVILFLLIFRFDTKPKRKQSKIGGASNCGQNNRWNRYEIDYYLFFFAKIFHFEQNFDGILNETNSNPQFSMIFYLYKQYIQYTQTKYNNNRFVIL